MALGVPPNRVRPDSDNGCPLLKPWPLISSTASPRRMPDPGSYLCEG